MKKSKTNEVGASDAIRDIVRSALKDDIKDAGGAVSNAFSEAIKKLGLDDTSIFSDYYKECIDNAVRKLRGAAEDLDFYVSCEIDRKKCDGLFRGAYCDNPRCGEANEEHEKVVIQAARVALDSIRTKKNGIEMRYGVWKNDKIAVDPYTGKDDKIGEYHECFIIVSPEATHLQKLKAASVFIRNMEKLCGRSVFLVEAKVFETGALKITVDFRVGYPKQNGKTGTSCGKTKKK